MTNPPALEEIPSETFELLERLAQMVSFLCGAAEIDGVSYGDKHPDKKGNFWWRTPLRTLENDIFAALTPLKGAAEPPLDAVLKAQLKRDRPVHLERGPKPVPSAYEVRSVGPIFVSGLLYKTLKEAQQAADAFDYPKITPLYESDAVGDISPKPVAQTSESVQVKQDARTISEWLDDPGVPASDLFVRAGVQVKGADK